MNKQDMEQLHPGDVIQNTKDSKWTFVVHQVFPDHLIAVRTIEVRNPEDWEVVKGIYTEVTPEEIIGEGVALDIDEAANEIDKEYRPQGWLQGVGVNAPINDTIFIYTVTKRFKKPFKDFYKGYRVKWRHAGKMVM